MHLVRIHVRFRTAPVPVAGCQESSVELNALHMIASSAFLADASLARCSVASLLHFCLRYTLFSAANSSSRTSRAGYLQETESDKPQPCGCTDMLLPSCHFQPFSRAPSPRQMALSPHRAAGSSTHPGNASSSAASTGPATARLTSPKVSPTNPSTPSLPGSQPKASTACA